MVPKNIDSQLVCMAQYLNWCKFTILGVEKHCIVRTIPLVYIQVYITTHIDPSTHKNLRPDLHLHECQDNINFLVLDL